MAQSHEVARSLCDAHGWPETRVQLVPIDTKGDILLDQALSELGGKGLFTQELESKLLSGDLDFAVHSLKDLPTQDPNGLCVAAIPPREDARDALILAPELEGINGLEDLPAQTSSGPPP
jgi:hydroxymethylbilane synthase